MGAPDGPYDAVSAGGSRTCGIDEWGEIGCWGVGFLGDFPEIPEPPPGGWFNRVAVGSDFGCAVDDADALVCWGDDAYGQVTGAP